jgi:predicted ATP-grasp superfamily ATP-dependent carboligase
MREAYRMQKNTLTESIINQEKFMAAFFIYTGNMIPEYKDVDEKMRGTLNRLNKIIDEAFAPNT